MYKMPIQNSSLCSLVQRKALLNMLELQQSKATEDGWKLEAVESAQCTHWLHKPTDRKTWLRKTIQGLRIGEGAARSCIEQVSCLI